MKRIIQAVLAAMALLAADAALADITLSPRTGNVWEILVFGNAAAVAEVLKGVTLMMSPSVSGGHGFRSLMVFMALLGFLISIVQAVADPGKNLLKAVTYILVAWAISYFTVTIKANVSVVDRLDGHTVVVDKVPALAAIPAAVVSKIGVTLTQWFEQNLSIPGSMKMSEGGQAMLFSRVMSAANEVRITDPEILKTMQAYVANCTVPAIARGRMTLGGLINSTDYVGELGKANYNAVLTSFYPSYKNFAETGDAQAFRNNCIGNSVDAAGNSVPATVAEAKAGQGILMTCNQAYVCLQQDLQNFAQAVLASGGGQMGTSGATVTLEQALSDALALQSRGQAYSGNFSSPNGYLMQRAAMATINGSFREAAIKSGNNEYLQAVAGAQAEQQQRSSWIAAAHSFKNIMGYIYIILQTFVFAIVPVVVIAMFIPGGGMAVAKNYFQVLIWLTLWMPLLSVVSYLSTLFAVSDLSGPFIAAGGLTVANSAAISEKAASLSDAADFLAASIPMFTWGLVKGTMAFTEFISHGLGMNYAQQAGATASTGNLSMNNMSMDSFNANKYSSVMSSAVGAQAVQGYAGAGGFMMKQEAGGGGFSVNGGDVQSAQSMQKAQEHAISSQITASKNKSAELSKDFNKRLESGLSHSSGWKTDETATLNALKNYVWANEHSTTAEERRAASEALIKANANQHAKSAEVGSDTRAGLSLPNPGGLSPFSAGTSVTTAVRSSDTESETNTRNTSTDKSTSTGTGSRDSEQEARQLAFNLVNSHGGFSSDSKDGKVAWSQSDAYKESQQISAQEQKTDQLREALSKTQSFGFNTGMDRNTFGSKVAEMQAVGQAVSAGIGDVAPSVAHAKDVVGGQAHVAPDLRKQAVKLTGPASTLTGNAPPGYGKEEAKVNAAKGAVKGVGVGAPGPKPTTGATGGW